MGGFNQFEHHYYKYDIYGNICVQGAKMFALVFNGITTRCVHALVYTGTKLIIGALYRKA